MKKKAKHALKKHYIIFVALCLLAAFIGVEFSESLGAWTPAVTLDTSTTSVDTAEQNNTPLTGSRWGLTDVLLGLLEQGGEKGKALSQEIQSNIQNESAQGSHILGRSRGVLSTVVNSLASGSFLITLLSAISSVIGSESLVISVLVVLSFLVMFAVWFFLTNVYTLLTRRIFLEGRLYQKLPVDRLLFLLRGKRWSKAALTMFLTSLFSLLWALTLVGWIVKRYSYYLVPYIVAENPDLGPLKTITLSRTMMQGHKWECFVLELSFFGWTLLSLVTFGLSALLFSNPYQVAVFSEYYARLRAQALETQLPGAQNLNDHFLFQLPKESVLSQAYQDTRQLIQQPRPKLDTIKGFRGFLANTFGILLSATPGQAAYEEDRALQAKIARSRKELEGLSYPTRLFPGGALSSARKQDREAPTHYLRHYTIWSLVLMFFLFALVGYLWEVVLHLVAEHELVNRGMLHGPWLPIYGSGAVMILVVLNKFRSKPALEFTLAVVLCGAVEYATSYITELTHNGQKWWDYTGYFLNLDGRICAEGLLVFGLGGMLVVYVLAPLLDNQIRRIPQKVLIPLALVLLSCFAVDLAISSRYPNAGKGITDDGIPTNTTSMTIQKED